MKTCTILSIVLLLHSPLSIGSTQSVKVKRSQEENEKSLRCLNSINDKLKNCKTKLINKVDSLFAKLFSFVTCCYLAEYYECVGDDHPHECNNPNSILLLKQTLKDVVSSQSERCFEYHYHSLTCLLFLNYTWIILIIIIFLLSIFTFWKRRHPNPSRPLVLPLDVNNISRKRFTHS